MKFKRLIFAITALLFALPAFAACKTNTPNPDADRAPIITASDPEYAPAEETVPSMEEAPALSPAETVSPAEETPPIPAAEETLPSVEETPSAAEPSAPESSSLTARYVLIKADSLNIRSGAGTNHSVVGAAEKETLYPLLSKTGAWYKTYYKNKTAYLSANEKYTAALEWERCSEEAERVVSEGAKLLGTPYVYGATRFHNGNGKKLSGFTEKEFDCSSLMQYIFYKGASVLLGVTTRTQVLQGVKVEKSDLTCGDLLFFTNDSRRYNTGIERVGHVALYLGNNYILHTASDYAKIEQISSKRWSYFLEARRVL